MCGIAGLVSPGNPVPDSLRKQVEKMTRVLRHRGPDHTGFFQAPDCVLGNTRLKIIDLSDRGGLPMASADGAVRIAYNGEVTNFKELRAAFALDKKYAFSSGADTEVVLHLYEELGIDFLRHLSGMFALAIYDAKKRKVFLVRDQYGMRPLFYMFSGARVFFSSEIKSFMELDCFRPELDREAIFHYFSLIYIPGERTPFAQVKELDGGHLLEIDLAAGTRELKEYYRFDYTIDREGRYRAARRHARFPAPQPDLRRPAGHDAVWRRGHQFPAGHGESPGPQQGYAYFFHKGERAQFRRVALPAADGGLRRAYPS